MGMKCRGEGKKNIQSHFRVAVVEALVWTLSFPCLALPCLQWVLIMTTLHSSLSSTSIFTFILHALASPFLVHDEQCSSARSCEFAVLPHPVSSQTVLGCSDCDYDR